MCEFPRVWPMAARTRPELGRARLHVDLLASRIPRVLCCTVNLDTIPAGGSITDRPLLFLLPFSAGDLRCPSTTWLCGLPSIHLAGCCMRLSTAMIPVAARSYSPRLQKHWPTRPVSHQPCPADAKVGPSAQERDWHLLARQTPWGWTIPRRADRHHMPSLKHCCRFPSGFILASACLCKGCMSVACDSAVVSAPALPQLVSADGQRLAAT